MAQHLHLLAPVLLDIQVHQHVVVLFPQLSLLLLLHSRHDGDDDGGDGGDDGDDDSDGVVVMMR